MAWTVDPTEGSLAFLLACGCCCCDGWGEKRSFVGLRIIVISYLSLWFQSVPFLCIITKGVNTFNANHAPADFSREFLPRNPPRRAGNAIQRLTRCEPWCHRSDARQYLRIILRALLTVKTIYYFTIQKS